MAIRGISKRRLRMICDSYLATRGARDVIAFLTPHGVTANRAIKIYREYGKDMEYGPDFMFFDSKDLAVSADIIENLYMQEVQKFGVDGTAFLTPFRRRTETSVDAMNARLQALVNPPAPGKAEAVSGQLRFRLGDKVMQIKNNYQLEWEIVSRYGIPIDSGQGVFNGDTGIIREINETAKTLIVEYDDMRRVTYPLSGLEEIELAYAITIHKSQGSEYPAVIMPLLTGPRMLFNRNLLYTGVTRAKNCVTILGSRDTVKQMIENASEQKRFTGLKDRICEIMQNMQEN